MSTLDYTAAIRRVFDDVLTRGELDAIDELISAECVGQDPSHPAVRGPSGFKDYVTELRTAFPDLRCTIEEICASGNTVVTKYTATGTNKGPLPGGIPATGKTSSITGISLVHFDASGKAKDWFVTWDTLGDMIQLGLIPDVRQGVPAGAQAQAGQVGQATTHG